MVYRLSGDAYPFLFLVMSLLGRLDHMFKMAVGHRRFEEPHDSTGDDG
jgi:hypothetical protein